MELSLTVFLLIAIGCALASAVVVSICFLCCCCLCGQDRQKGWKKQRERVLYDVESPCVVQVRTCQPSRAMDPEDKQLKKVQDKTEKKNSGLGTDGGGSHYMFDERQVAEKARCEQGGLLWTSEGQVFLDGASTDHVVEVFTSTNKHPSRITELYMKESPCYACSTKLIDHFKHTHKKPTLFVGRIRHLHNISDREGLRQLIQEGFDINLWTHLHRLMNAPDSATSNYLRDLKNETAMFCYYGIYN